MSFFSFKKKSRVPSQAEANLKLIQEALFPNFEYKDVVQPDGQKLRYGIDYSVDSNLDTALQDLQEGYNDESTRKSIIYAIEKLAKVREIIEAYPDVDSNCTHIIIDNDTAEIADRFEV